MIVTAGYLPHEQKLPVLKKISIQLDIAKILLRLSFETKCIDSKKYQRLAAYLIEIGKMLGGWIRSIG